MVHLPSLCFLGETSSGGVTLQVMSLASMAWMIQFSARNVLAICWSSRKISFFSFFQCYFCYSFLWCKTQKNINQLVPAAILVSICLLVLVFSCFNPMSFSFSSCHLQFIQLPLNKVVGTMKAFPSEGNLPEKDKVCHLALQNTPICADTCMSLLLSVY